MTSRLQAAPSGGPAATPRDDRRGIRIRVDPDGDRAWLESTNAGSDSKPRAGALGAEQAAERAAAGLYRVRARRRSLRRQDARAAPELRALRPRSGFGAAEARICSYECTFCADCVEDVLSGICPDCGGNLVPRPSGERAWRPTTA
jgi:hypothetical protein